MRFATPFLSTLFLTACTQPVELQSDEAKGLLYTLDGYSQDVLDQVALAFPGTGDAPTAVSAAPEVVDVEMSWDGSGTQIFDSVSGETEITGTITYGGEWAAWDLELTLSGVSFNGERDPIDGSIHHTGRIENVFTDDGGYDGYLATADYDGRLTLDLRGETLSIPLDYSITTHYGGDNRTESATGEGSIDVLSVDPLVQQLFAEGAL